MYRYCNGNFLFMKIFQKSISAFFNNWMTTIPATIVIAILLTLFHTLVLVRSGAEKLVTSLESKVTLTFYIKEKADPFEVSSLIKNLETHRDLISKVDYTSSQDALNLLNKAFSLDTTLIEKYNVQLPASIVVTPTRVDSLDGVTTLVRTTAKNLLHPTKNSDVATTKATDDLKAFLTQLESSTTKVLSFFLVLFGFGGILLITSTIHITLSHREHEVTIMHYIGAQEHTIVAPFIIEGAIIGVFSFILNVVFISILPFGSLSSTVAQNALIAEFLLSCSLTTLVSYLATIRVLK